MWNLPLPGGAELWQRVGAPRVDAQRGAGVAEAEIGRGLADELVPVLDRLERERRLSGFFLSGGLCAIGGFREALAASARKLPVAIADDPVWAAAEAGLARLAERGSVDGAVVDVGQTSIKLLSRGPRRVLERDTRSLPLRLIAEDGTSQGAPTAPLAAFLRTALASLDVPPATADPRVLLALPCPIEEDLLPGPCSYGWQGDGDLLPAVFGALPDSWPDREVRVEVLNDAELAAEAARRALAPAPGARVLCLTLGFGPGGALLET